VNSLSVQESIYLKISEYITEETGWVVKIDSATSEYIFSNRISLKNGVIRLHNVSLVCDGQSWIEWKRNEHLRLELTTPFNPDEIDINWTYWNLKVESIDVKVSLWQFLDGTGMIKSSKFKVTDLFKAGSPRCCRSRTCSLDFRLDPRA
jgi:distribution and morphology protein 31